MDWMQFDDLIEMALEEDGARKDATTNALIDPGIRCEADMIAKEEGVICGLPLGARICELFDADLQLHASTGEGTHVVPGTEVATIEGPAGSLLKVERTMLNFLQRLSGVASVTRRFVEAVAGTGARILDTRKTTPGWRVLEKYAVRCGGGTNHRMGLNDMVLIKDNHIRLRSRGETRTPLASAVERARAAAPTLEIEVEVESLLELREVLDARPDYVLLDNMAPQQVASARDVIREACGEGGGPQIEASGGIGLDTVRDYADAGADRISIGGLTHSAPALDVSLNIR
jgi:nicotinate-nucleotide pyrophosphorylase (carboxylating)